METAALYTLASKYKAKALSILTISDSLVSPEITSSEEREKNIQWNDWTCSWNSNKIKIGYYKNYKIESKNKRITNGNFR